MEKIKFRSQDSNEKEFAKEVRKRVRQYFKDNNISTHGNYKMYIKMVVMMAMYVSPFLLVLFMDMSPWMALVMALIIGVGEASMAM